MRPFQLRIFCDSAALGRGLLCLRSKHKVKIAECSQEGTSPLFSADCRAGVSSAEKESLGPPWTLFYLCWALERGGSPAWSCVGVGAEERALFGSWNWALGS